MLTVTKLARSAGLSRGTILYYESIGLLKAAGRTAGNYRSYGENALRRLEQICLYRKSGLKLNDIRALLDKPENGAAAVLERRLRELNAEIATLRGHQQSILRLLRNQTSFGRDKDKMTKDKWVSIMKASGFTEADMQRWHIEFERAAPEEHQQFLEFLHIGAEEIRTIRTWSQGSPQA